MENDPYRWDIPDHEATDEQLQARAEHFIADGYLPDDSLPLPESELQLDRDF